LRTIKRPNRKKTKRRKNSRLTLNVKTWKLEKPSESTIWIEKRCSISQCPLSLPSAPLSAVTSTTHFPLIYSGRSYRLPKKHVWQRANVALFLGVNSLRDLAEIWPQSWLLNQAQSIQYVFSFAFSPSHNHCSLGRTPRTERKTISFPAHSQMSHLMHTRMFIGHTIEKC
jgi:hypothetical protein